MNITTLTEQLRTIKIVPVIALDNAADAVPLGAALRESGIPVAEITFRSPAAAEAIRRLRDADPDILIAAGTVLNAAQAKAAQQAGADFIVSPGFNPTAIEAALEHGIDTVKYFPAEASGGIPMLKALLAPYAMLKIMPTGGINAKNIRDYLAIKNVIACGGSWMVEKSLLATQNWAEVERLGKEAVALVQE